MNLKQKNILLLLGFLLLVCVAYLFSFSKTIEAKKNYSTLKQQDGFFISASQNRNQLIQQDAYYSSLLKKHQISSESSFQNNLLNTLNTYAKKNKLKIINFKDPHRFNLNNNAIQETYLFTVQSNYNSIIKLIYHLEQHPKFGKIISADFEKKRNYKTSKENLQCAILLQKMFQE